MRGAAPGVDAAAGGAGGSVDADADELSLGVVDLFGGVGEQGERHAPWDQPSEVGGEPVGELDADGAGEVFVGVQLSLAEVDDPFAAVDAPSELDRVDGSGWGEVDGDASCPVDRRHVRVVRRVGGES